MSLLGKENMFVILKPTCLRLQIIPSEELCGSISCFAILRFKPHSAVWFLLNNSYFFSTAVSSPFNIMYK